MKIVKIEVKNVKSFDGVASAVFDRQTSMFSFSGANGAGKSTFLRVAWLIQRAHFAESHANTALQSAINFEVRRYLNNDDSYASLTLAETKYDNEKEEILALPKITLNLSKLAAYNITYEDKQSVDRIWNPNDPQNLILFVDASKSFSEETLSFDELNISGNEKKTLALEAIHYPEKLFSGIYRQLIKDYVHSRLIPSTPDRLLYYHVAAKIFKHLIPRIELRNFSGNYSPGEFVLLGKTNSDKYKPLYDVREFSSGEKALLSTLMFLCISKSVSALIIDEPENHFHESLLLEFMSLLSKLCKRDGIAQWISEHGTDGKKINSDWLALEYKGHHLEQVIFSTHSKPLIYKTFSLGKNFIVNKSIVEIRYDDAEAKMREIGLSTTNSKVLFVEGNSDNEALESLLTSRNVIIKPLTGSSAVIDTFRRVAEINSHIHATKFLFLIDSDNKPEEFFSDLRKINPKFFDEHFIKLDAHEFENLFLESTIFKKTIDKINELTGNKLKNFSKKDINDKLEELAKESLPSVYRKELSLTFIQNVERHYSSLFWGNKNFKWDDLQSIGSQVTSTLNEDNEKKLNTMLYDSAKTIFSVYENIDTIALLRRCDGKQVLGRAAAYFGKQIGVEHSTFKKVLFNTAFDENSSLAAKLSSRIIKGFS